MDIVIGMILAFLLGAYVRQPFPFKKEEKVITDSIDEEFNELKKAEELEMKKRQLQMYRALQWNGKKGKLTDED